MEDYKIVRHSEIVNLFIHRKELTRSFTVEEHTILHVHNGQLDIIGEDGAITMSSGQSIFLRRNHKVKISRHPGNDGSPHQSIGFNIPRKFLIKFYHSMKKDEFPAGEQNCEDMTILPSRPDLNGFFDSFIPFYETEMEPDAEWLDMKFKEGLHILLKSCPQVYTSLLDFAPAWKIDILSFMEDNFTYELSIKDIAHYTGRSLATFKRDFAKISDTTPEKWILQRRLNAARELLLRGNCSVSEAAAECGFNNISFFSRSYKNTFGIPPSKENTGM